MRLLFVTIFYPYPLDAGGKTSLHNLIKHLSRYHDITLLALFDPKKDIHSQSLGNYCTDIITVEKRSRNSRWDFVMTAIPFTAPSLIRSNYEPEMQKRLTDLIKSGRFDIILYAFTQSSVYIQSGISEPQILSEEDILYLKSKRQFEITPWIKPLSKLINYLEYKKIRKIEIGAWNKVTSIITVTETDREKIKQHRPHLNVRTIPRGIDFENYKPDRQKEGLNDKILFLGSTLNTLNVDGLRLFLEKIWPFILSKKPKTEFKIIGGGFGNIFDREKFKNIEEIGFVKDLMPYFNSSKVFVVPLLNGGGLRIKILEAMAAGCPIVTTSIGCEGIDIVNGQDAFIEDDITTFADAVLRLLDDSELRQKFSKNARDKVLRNYSWGPIISEFNSLAESLKKEK